MIEPARPTFNLNRFRRLQRREKWFHRAPSLASTAWTTLLRSPPLRLWSIDPKLGEANQRRDGELRQMAIIKAGMKLGFVHRSTSDGWIIQD